ncbi:hypothetical protein [Pilimelia terevasa]|nr:hypothetical protein [Pilimelia terevasa]
MTGTPAEVAAMLHRHQAGGDLVLVNPPRPVADGRIAVTVRTVPAPGAALAVPAASPPVPLGLVVVRRYWRPVLAGGSALAVVGAAGWAVWLVVGFVAVWWPLLLAGVAVVWLGWAVAGRGGRHCPGC